MNETDDFDMFVSHWLSLFSSILDMHAPIKSFRVSERHCPWIDTNPRKLMQSRDKLKKAATRSESPLHMSSYRHIRNKINKHTSELKSNTFLKKSCKRKVV